MVRIRTKSVLSAVAIVLAVMVSLLVAPSAYAAGSADFSCGPGNGENVGGFDELGYNETANIYVGVADCVDGTADSTVYGDPTYANDLLIMKSSESWPDSTDSSTWLNNNWNGQKPGGSGENWHYKIDANTGCIATDGSCIWNDYELIQSHGTSGGVHIWDVPNDKGYGVKR